MPNVYQSGLLQIRPRYTQEVDGDHTENVTWWVGSVTTSNYTLGQLVAIQNTFDPLMSALWAPCANSGAQYIGSVITDWTSATGLSNDNTTTFTPVTGSGGGTVAPAQVCILISQHIAQRFRGGHGRIYLPWIGSSGSFNSSTVPSALVTSTNTKLQALYTGMGAISGANGGPCLPVVYRYRNSSTLASVHAVTSGNTSNVWATQRRRLRKVPHH